MIVTLISAVIGNIFGYTVMKNVCAGMYYGSYSLPTYVTVWNAEAFLYTTVVPVLLMLLINVLILYRQMKLGPLQFLRRDLSRKKNRRAVGLSPCNPFLFQVSDPGHTAEHGELCDSVYWNFLCINSAFVWTIDGSDYGSLPG